MTQLQLVNKEKCSRFGGYAVALSKLEERFQTKYGTVILRWRKIKEPW